MKRPTLSTLELMLISLFCILLVACAGLIAVGWLVIHDSQSTDNQTSHTTGGTFKITQGATYQIELENKESNEFKDLAQQVETMITNSLLRSGLREEYTSCEVLQFRNGSVDVWFSLQFSALVSNEEVLNEMVASIEANEGSFLGKFEIDVNSIEIKPPQLTTQIPSTTTPTNLTTPSSAPELTTQILNSTTPTNLTTPSSAPKLTTQIPNSTIGTNLTMPSSGNCSAGYRHCSDKTMCIESKLFCNGEPDCPDSSDENEGVCATACDGKFLLIGDTGSFHSINFPKPYDPNVVCRWIISVDPGLYIKVNFTTLQTEESYDLLTFYEGTGSTAEITATLSGNVPLTVRVLSNRAAVVFKSDDNANEFIGFNATYTVFNISAISDQEKVSCDFQDGFCYWKQCQSDMGEWERYTGPQYPPFIGPNSDHTYGNNSGYYAVTTKPPSGDTRDISLLSPLLSLAHHPFCLSFWYHMYGSDVSRFTVYVVSDTAEIRTAFQKQGDYGDQWYHGQLTLNETTSVQVVFEAIKNPGIHNDIALDDIALTDGLCQDSGQPEPTNVPKPTSPPAGPTDCGGPTVLMEPNTTFSSMNYPNNYVNFASCTWYVVADEGKNVHLHFQDFSLETIYDIVEVRDGRGEGSLLMAVYTGSEPVPDLYSTTSQMSILFTSDESGLKTGFLANFTTGYHLGLPAPCLPDEYQCESGQCIPVDNLCDGLEQCADADDEKHCVRLVNGSRSSDGLVQFNVRNKWYSTCADEWPREAADLVCVTLGFRDHNNTWMMVAMGSESLVNVTVTSEGALLATPSHSCSTNKIMLMTCNSKPCGTRLVGPTESTRIVGGVDASEGSWPWIVSLYFGSKHVCGATVVNREWLVTAAHCVYGRTSDMSRWSALVGLHTHLDQTSPQIQRREIDRVLISPRYNKRSKDSDVALMHMVSALNYTDYVQPVCLPDRRQDFSPGLKCTIAGWGAIRESGPAANILQEAAVPLIANAKCQQQLPQNSITVNMLCAGYEEGNIDTCQGDSGGPLVCEEDGRWFLAGVTSFGDGCARPQRPGVYARVTECLDWIQDVSRLD